MSRDVRGALHRRGLLGLIAAALVLVAGSVSSIAAWTIWRNDNDEALRGQLRTRAEDVATRLQHQIDATVDALRTVQGLHSLTGGFDAATFQHFVDETIDFAGTPAMTGMAWVARVDPRDVDVFVAERRAKGQPEFDIRPREGWATKFVLTYTAPADGSDLGGDLATDPPTSATLHHAWRTGEPTASNVYRLDRNDPTSDTAVGIYLPVYEPGANGRAHGRLAGFAATAFRGDQLLETVLQPFHDRVAVTATVDGTNGPHMLGIYGEPTSDDVVTTAVQVGNRVWRLHVQPGEGFPRAEHEMMGFVLLGAGIVVSMLLAALVGLTTRSRLRALLLVDRRTAELALAERRMRTLFWYAPIGMAVIDMDAGGEVVEVNVALTQLLGRSASDLTAGPIDELIHPMSHTTMRDALASASADDRFEVRLQTSDGQEVWVQASVAPLPDEHHRRAVLQFEDITAQRSLREALTHRALHDALTGLPNRTLLEDRIAQALAGAARTGRSVALLFVDMDRFKWINDTLGHEVGDAALIATASRLRTAIRPRDTAARIAGDEFVVVCEDLASDPATALREAAAVADRIATTVSAPFDHEGTPLTLSASIGVAVADVGSHSPAELLRQADVAMYQAKRAGRAHVAVYEGLLREHASRRVHLEQTLAGALERGEFEVHYQPIVELASGSTVGVEALLRWRHPTIGLLGPDEFLEIIEDAGLIERVGRYVLDQACEDTAPWARAVGPDFQVHVNLAARQLAHGDLVGEVAAALDRSGLPSTSLCLELTEHTALSMNDAMMAAVRRIRSLGVHLAIDDFGTGYSSLVWLKRFPLDVLKIDRTFTAGIGESADDEAIVDSVVGLGQALGLHVVAEGVESEEHAEWLRQRGCGLAQGWYFGRAVPAEEFAAALPVGPLVVR